MAILQQQRQHQQGGIGGAAAGGGSSKLSPSHLGAGLSKQSMVDPLTHPAMGGSLSELHAKTQGMYSGESGYAVKITLKSCVKVQDVSNSTQTGAENQVVPYGNNIQLCSPTVLDSQYPVAGLCVCQSEMICPVHFYQSN